VTIVDTYLGIRRDEVKFSRRHFLRTAAAASLGFGGLQRLFASTAYGQTPAAAEGGFGPLLPDPQGIVELPAGFSYRKVAQVGDTMTDGLLVPGEPDGMAAFPGGPEGKTILVCNHEITSSPGAGPFGDGNELLKRIDPAKVRDRGHGKAPCLGGTTTLIYDTAAGRLESQHLSLVGTVRNCAGGPTPWNTWISCEESDVRAEDTFERNHGYNFEVPALPNAGLATPVPLVDMGRFVHEAVAVDPASGIVYQTEDRGDSLIYRFIPHKPGQLAAGGRLQALRVREKKGLDTRNWDAATVPVGAVLAVEWVDIEEVKSPNNDLRFQGFAKGAARFAWGEGMWYGRGAVFFVCTNGGSANKGQVWRYVPSPHEGTLEEEKEPGTLELLVEPNDGGLIDNADNLIVAPWGDLILCEDGGGEQFMVGVTPEGGIYKFGRNAQSNSEFAGATFSPDGTTLFVNIQHPGLTLAITGPWGRGKG
jgi:secreted PhoX family phosphatase